jgi:hypothetical protein
LLHDARVSNLAIRPLTIRARRSEDLDLCVEVLREVRLANGYPVKWPSDPRSWLPVTPTSIPPWPRDGSTKTANGDVPASPVPAKNQR